MKILVINAGSSTLKFQLIDMQNENVIAKGNCERVTINGSFFKYSANGKELKIEQEMPNHKVAFELILKTLLDKEVGVISSVNEISAVGHRVVSAGDKITQSTLVTDEVLKELKNCVDFAPIHIPASLLGIEAVLEKLPNAKNALVFDTSFHSTMPAHAYRYGLPEEVYNKYHVRKYGAHGTSHKYVSEEYLKISKKSVQGSKIISCHLGSGSSVTAIKDGISVDTSMGFTPLEGLMMGTRSGDIDPSILEYLVKKTNKSLEELTSMLNKKSGFLGLTGYSDIRDIEANLDNPQCQLAFDIFEYKIRKYIGAYVATMGGVDAIIFTAGIGEKDPLFRNKLLSNLKYLGIKLLPEHKQKKEKTFTKLSARNSKVDVYVIPTNEELVIARETAKLINN